MTNSGADNSFPINLFWLNVELDLCFYVNFLLLMISKYLFKLDCQQPLKWTKWTKFELDLCFYVILLVPKIHKDPFCSELLRHQPKGLQRMVYHHSHKLFSRAKNMEWEYMNKKSCAYKNVGRDDKVSRAIHFAIRGRVALYWL